MKKIQNGIKFKKTIIAMIFVILCNFIVPNFSYADSRTDVSDALCDFFCALPDAAFFILQNCFLGEGDAKIHVYSKEEETEGTPWYGKWDIFDIFWNGEFDLPNIRFTPYHIFSNKIPVLNANFFGESTNGKKTVYYFPGYLYYYYSETVTISPYAADNKEDITNYIREALANAGSNINQDYEMYKIWADWIGKYLEGNMTANELNEKYKAWVDYGAIVPTNAFSNDYDNFAKAVSEESTGGQMAAVPETPEQLNGYVFEQINQENIENYNEKLPNKYKAKGVEDDYNKLCEMIQEQEDEVKDSSVVLKPIVSKWYGILRSLALIGLLIVLVFCAIKILISSASKDKAKYKQILKDWLVAMCLVFVLHFIMSFTMYTIDSLIGMLENSSIENKEEPVPKDIECKEDEAIDMAAYTKHIKKFNNGTEVKWTCNPIEDIRYKAEMAKMDLPVRMGYIVVYMILAIQTFMFTWQYFKRVVYMAILTLLAPIIAFTYPIDKMIDGKSQGFNMWLKEYIFNALIQFVHLLLYYIIITSVVELLQNNPVYGIVALACIRKVEKLLRQFFSVGKQSNTVGPFDGAAGAALVMSGMDKLSNFGNGDAGASGGESQEEKAPKIYQNKESFDPMQVLMGGNGEEELLNAGSESVNTGGVQPVEVDTGNAGDAETDSAERENAGGNARGNAGGDIYADVLNHLNNRNAPQAPRPIKHPKLFAAKYAAQNRFRGMPGKTVRSLGSTAGHGILRGIGGIGGAAIGLAAGVASGDASKTLKYMTAGAYATGKVLDKVGTRVGQGFQAARSDYKQGRMSIDAGYAGDIRLKEFKKNPDNITYLASRYSDKDEREQVYEIAKESTKYGIDDVQDVSAIHELVKRGRSVDHAIAIAKMSKKTGDLIRKPKNRKDWNEKLTKQKNFTEKQAKTILNDIEMFQSQKD